MTEPNQHLNSAQVAAIEAKIREHVAAVVKDVALRQWAVEQTLKYASAESDFNDVAKLFVKTYEFISAPTISVPKIEG